MLLGYIVDTYSCSWYRICKSLRGYLVATIYTLI